MIFKINKREAYAIVDKRIFSSDMTWKAKGILCYLLSHNDGWEVRIEDLIRHSKEGRTAVKAAMKELREKGYAELQPIRNESGRVVGRRYVIYEDPEHRKSGFPTVGFSDDRKTCLIKKDTSKEVSKEAQKEKEDTFPKFWNAYGYKKDRRNAEKAWRKLTADEKEKALTCAPIYASDTVLEDRPGREWKPRRKFPATWLNAKGWEEYEERAAERSEADAGPTPYDEQYAKYLQWASSFQLITAAVKYLSKRQFCEYKERDYRMADNLRWQLLRQAHERFEAGDTATPDVFTLYSDMAAARQKQAQTI